MTTLNDYLGVSKTVPETPDVNSLDLYELTANGTSRTKIQAAASLAADVTLTLPVDDGNNNQVLKTDGSGVLSWTDLAGSDTLTISKDTDAEFVALKLINESDAGDTTGKVSLEFDLEDTSGTAVDSGKITVIKEQSFTNTASTQDSTMEFYTSFDGTLTKTCEMTSGKHLEIQGGLKIGLGGVDYGTHGGALKQLFIQSTYNGNTSEDYGWWIGTQNETLSATDNDLFFGVVRNGSLAVPAQIEDDEGSAVQMNFTGQHRCFINNELSDMIGLLVSSTGNYVNIDNTNTPNINESLPICELSNTNSDKSVFGVVSEQEDTDTSRKFKPSNFVSVYPKINTNERRYHINSLGEGSIWITNKNDNLDNGDYITTSTIPGYGQKQTGDQLCNYTAAKVTCDCNFSITKISKQKVKVIVSGSTQTLDFDSSGNIQYENDLDSTGNQQLVYPFNTRFLLSDGTQITESNYTTRLANGESVYIACFVGCTYHCG